MRTRKYINPILILYLPSLVEPQLHIACVGVGTFVGYQVHAYEERNEGALDSLREMQAKKAGEMPMKQ